MPMPCSADRWRTRAGFSRAARSAGARSRPGRGGRSAPPAVSITGAFERLGTRRPPESARTRCPRRDSRRRCRVRSPARRILARRLRAVRIAAAYWFGSRNRVERRVRRPASNWARPEGWACVRSMLFDDVGAKRSKVSDPATSPSFSSQDATTSSAASATLASDTAAPFTSLSATCLDHNGMSFKVSEL